MNEKIGLILIALGVLFDLFGCVGLVRLPDVYNRIQASTKCVVLGTTLILLGAMVLFFVFMGRGKRKTEAKRKEMLSALKKGDKVTTIGGIIGTVMDIRENEVTIKIDENNNTRMRFIRSAVRGVGAEAKKEDVEEQK